MHAARTLVTLCLAILLGSCSTAFALNPALDISQYAHKAWTIREGFLPGGVGSIAQTPDGYLWVGTEFGLFRFDGVRAVRWPAGEAVLLRDTAIAKLLVTRDGRLWIGTTAGLVSWKDGRLVTYPELAGHTVNTLVEDSRGAVWAGTTAVPNALLCAFRGAIECAGADGRFGSAVLSVLEDRGTLWVGAATGLWRWTPGDPTRYAVPSALSDLLRIRDGPLLVATNTGVMRIAGETLVAHGISGVDPPFDAERLLQDRHGSLWIAARRRGLVHVHQGRVDVFTPAEGLSGDSVRALYEDREGNIWVGTEEGLDRFRELAVTTVSTRQGLPDDYTVSVLPAREGSVWFGSEGGVTRWKDGRATIYGTRDGLPDDRVGTMFEDSRGRILAATLSGMAAFDGDHFVPLRSMPTRIVYNIVEQPAGELWITDQSQGLIRLVEGEVVNRTPWSAFGRDDHATALVADRTRAGLWLGFYKGGVMFVRDGQIRASYATADGLGAGRIAELQIEDDGTLWAATAGGLSRIKDDRITTITTKNGLPCQGVHWMRADADRSRWLLTPCGLVRIGAADLEAWIANPERLVTTSLLDSSDGVRSQSTPIAFTPTAAWLPDGRLWFAMPSGVGVLDPGRLPVNPRPPPVHIEQIVADRITYDATTSATRRVDLPPRVHDLQIDYTALSLVAPEKVRFRYKLEGFDRDWQEVRNRRQAFYTDLPPRQYRFRVAAANESGVWNETGATLDFAIAPAYYQTRWFMALSAGLVVALVWAGYRVRLRVIERHQREITALNERLMKAQEQERIRIAGELHDGVMQDMLAVTMMLGTAKRRIDGSAEAKATIDKVQARMIQMGTDLRQLSHELHPPMLQEAGLPQALRTYCDEFSSSCGIPVSCEADDEARELSRGSALALFRIVQEALGNAAKHAAAGRISVRLSRSNGLVAVEVADDGVGFDRNRIGSAGLGLITMRERATQLNGTFDVSSAPGRGTTIRVAIPFR